MKFIETLRRLSQEELKRIIKTDSDFVMADDYESNLYTVSYMLEYYGADQNIENTRKAVLDLFDVEEEKRSYQDEIREKAITDKLEAIQQLERQRVKIESELLKLYQEEKELQEHYNKQHENI